MRTVYSDCRHYRGDRPCAPHKDHGVVCEGCPYYDRIDSRVLIIKLGAAGDVLRTTALLGSLKDLSPRSHVTWVCGRHSVALIRHTPLIDRPLPLTEETLTLLDHEAFDLCVNFDLDPVATAIDGRVRAKVHKGFGRRPDGTVFAYDEAGEVWLHMSLWDDAKKANRDTYQAHMRRILGAPEVNHPILVTVLPEKAQRAEAFAQEHRFPPARGVIGFNVGAGDRWQHKKWTVEGYVELGERIHHELHATLLMLYGPADFRRAVEVMSAMTVPFVDAGMRASMMEFIALLNLCDVVVTGDTFGLHAALGLGKRVVCLVGPTAAQELELYGLGVILQGEIDCLGCYLTRCDKDPFCMKLLRADAVFEAVKAQWEKP